MGKGSDGCFFMCKGVLLCLSLWWLIGGHDVTAGQEFPMLCHLCMPHAKVSQDPRFKRSGSTA